MDRTKAAEQSIALDAPINLREQLGVQPSGAHEWSALCEIGANSRLFGGQVIAQVLVAAAADVADPQFAPRSVHAHFLRAGSPSRPVQFEVSALTDGRSFATRQVLAVQSEVGSPRRIIATAVVAFCRPEKSTEHQSPMPVVAGPDDLAVDHTIPLGTNPRVRLPFELRTPPRISDNPADAGHRQVWVRSRQALDDDPILNAAALVWIADFSLPWATDGPHAHEPGQRTGASLDHTLWFHRSVDLAGWYLLDQLSPIYAGARGLAIGHFYAQDGSLAATAVQESLVRRV